MGNGVNIGKVFKDIKIGNNSVGKGAKNQDNQCITVVNVENSDNGVTIAVDLINGVFADVLAYLFSPLSL